MSKAEPGKVIVRDTISASVDGAWNRPSPGAVQKSETWTIEGLPPDRPVFYSGIADGEALGELQERQIPKFRAAMRPHAIVERYKVYATYDGSSYRREKLAPAPFAGGEDFRFGFSRRRKGDGFEMRGIDYERSPVGNVLPRRLARFFLL